MFRVMIVEDEPPILRSIKDKIISIDPDFKIVGEYENGEDALLEIHIVKPHVLITDIRMPIMDGITLLEKVRKTYPDIICAILSGYEEFEYARQSLRLGVSDYLLKPPTNETIKEFLLKIKSQLMQNQMLIESELLQHWTFPSHDTYITGTTINTLIREYFYHANYVFVYAWCPPELRTMIPVLNTVYLETNLLKDGEKYYPIPSSSTYESILIFGVHGLSNERLQQWPAFFKSLHPMKSISFILIQMENGLSQIPVLLAKARKTAYISNRIDEVTASTITFDDSLPDTSRIHLPPEQVHHLVSFLQKQKRQDFRTQLDSLLHYSSLGNATRLQWTKTMLFLLQNLVSQTNLANNPEVIRIMEHEIEEAAWQALTLNELYHNLKEILDQCFHMDSEQTENQWINELEIYVKSHYMTDITLSSLADRFKLNATYLSRVFKREKQKSPLDYLVELRVEEAKRLILNHPRLLFKEIAEQVGYPDPYYFSKLFKQWTGQTPTEFKKENGY